MTRMVADVSEEESTSHGRGDAGDVDSAVAADEAMNSMRGSERKCTQRGERGVFLFMRGEDVVTHHGMVII